jgi:hypothetical protein
LKKSKGFLARSSAFFVQSLFLLKEQSGVQSSGDHSFAVAKCKIMVDAKFNKGCLKVNLKSLYRFIPDTPYWRIWDLNARGFPENETEYDYEPYGPKNIPTGVHFD